MIFACLAGFPLLTPVQALHIVSIGLTFLAIQTFHSRIKYLLYYLAFLFLRLRACLLFQQCVQYSNMALNKGLKGLECAVPNYASLAVRSIFQIGIVVCRDVYRPSHMSRSNVVFSSCTSFFFLHLEPIIRFSPP